VAWESDEAKHLQITRIFHGRYSPTIWDTKGNNMGYGPFWKWRIRSEELKKQEDYD